MSLIFFLIFTCLISGLRKDVSALHVDENGNISQVKGVGTRKQELEKKRLMLNNAKERQLQERAERLLDEGAGKYFEDYFLVFET